MYYEIHAHASSGQVQVSQGVHVLSLLFSSLDFFGTELLPWLPKELNFFESKRISEDRVIKKKEKKKKEKERNSELF